MTETCVSQILYELNGIWRAIMRKEADAVKKHFTGMVQDLRRQLVTKRAFDEEEAHKEITRLKKELQFLQKTNANKKNKNGTSSGDLQQQTKENTAANAFKRPETDKRNEATELRNKITQLERQRLNHNANVIGPLSAMSQQYSDMDASSQRYGGGLVRNNEEIGPSFFGKNSTFGGNMAGSGAGTLMHEGDNVSQGYSDFA